MESLCRWLASNGKKEIAEDILLKIARWNKKHITVDERQEIRRILTNIEEDSSQTSETKLNVVNMFKGKNFKNTLIMLLNWVTVNVGTYTLLLNTTKLNGDLFINFILSTLIGEFPGVFVLMVTMKFFGRRMNMFLMQAILGTCCIIMAFLPKSVS